MTPQEKHSAGLTLIEVLVALAIVAIAMTAIIKAVSQHIRSVTHLQEKTVALWVGQNVISEASLGLLSLSTSEAMNESTEMLGRTWYWQAREGGTPNPSISKITVNVYTNAIENGNAPIMTLEGYRYHEK